jgi:hypothetical protein
VDFVPVRVAGAVPRDRRTDSDVLYVSELIRPDVVNTMPAQTVRAFADHGVVAQTVDTDRMGEPNSRRRHDDGV